MEALEPRRLLCADWRAITGLARTAIRIRHRLGDPAIAATRGNHPTAPVSAAPDLRHSTAVLSEARANLSAIALGTKAFFSGGIGAPGSPAHTVDIYDAVTGQWSSKQLSSEDDAREVVKAGDQVLFSGFGTSPAVDIFNSATGQWSEAQFSQQRNGYTSLAAGTKAYFAGGFYGSPAVPGTILSNVVDVYDSTTHGWTAARLSQPRETPAAAAVGSKVIFAGGVIGDRPDQPASYTDAVDIYDSATNRWSTARLSVPRSNIGVAIVGDLAIFAGGLLGSKPTRAVDIYDADTSRWSHARLPRPRNGTPAITLGTKAFFPGSTRDGSVDVFDAITGHWSRARLSQHGDYLSATSVGAKVLFAGGDSGGANAPFVDVYDATTGAWSTAPLSVGRTFSAATTVDDRALFAGGRISIDTYPVSDAVDIFEDASPSALLSGSVTGRAGSNLTVTVSNTGDAPLPAGATVTVYASADRTLIGAVPLGQINLTGALAAGSSIDAKVRTFIPTTLAPGSYHVLAAIKPGAHAQPIPIAAQSQTFTVASPAVARFHGLFARASIQ